MKYVFMVSAAISIVAVILICLFLFVNAMPAFGEIGIFKFLTGQVWKPSSGQYGILPMIVGSVYVTAGAILIGGPIGVLTAMFLARFCHKRLYRPLKTGIQVLAAIPSIVYGFFGMVMLVPIIRELTNYESPGTSILTASILLGIMILPTIISVSEAAIKAVPQNYYEASIALGASHEKSVFFVVLPAARSGVMAAIILGVGRAIGETMAVILVTGNQARMPKSILQGVRTLTTNVALEMGYAEGLQREALIATAVVLFVFILLINLLFSIVKRRSAI